MNLVTKSVSRWEMYRLAVEPTNDGTIRIIGEDVGNGEPCVTISHEQVDALIEWLKLAKERAIDGLIEEHASKLGVNLRKA